MKEALTILNKLENLGFSAYIIGGYPRNLYLGIEPTDIDLCTNAKEEDIKKIVPIIKSSYGSMQIKGKEQIYEITTFRKDITYTNHRKPSKIEYVNTLKEDIMRRDFIMNTLALNSKQEYIDYLGAKKDIEHHIIRCVGNPYQKLEEDALRILRAIRFSIELDFTIENTLKQAIFKMKQFLKTLSKERISQELKKCFMKNSIKSINLLKYYELDEILDLKLEHFTKTNHWLAILCQIDPHQHYVFSKKDKKLVTQLLHLSTYQSYSNTILYTYPQEVWEILDTIKHQNLKERYLKLPIHKRHQIKVDKTRTDLTKIYPILEYEILENKLDNNKLTIQNYLLKLDIK